MLINSFRKLLIAGILGCVTTFSLASTSAIAADNSSHDSKIKLDQKSKGSKGSKETLKEEVDEGLSRCYAYMPGCKGSDAQRNLVPIQLFEPTYILPAYYTYSPNYQQWPSASNPGRETLNKMSFKFQLSLLWTIWPHMFGKPISLNAAYTQRSFWQVYAQSQWFNSTNYMPELFLSAHLFRNLYFHVGLVHQSNGRGIPYERSWNRAFVNLLMYGNSWMFSVEPWILIFKHSSSTLHNPDIAHYLGHGRFLFAIKFWDRLSVSLMSRNNLESRFKRGAEEVELSYKLYDHFSLFAQGFSGYGQTLLSYDHYTNALGIGISFNEWV